MCPKEEWEGGGLRDVWASFAPREDSHLHLKSNEKKAPKGFQQGGELHFELTVRAATCRLAGSSVQNLPSPIAHSWEALALLISEPSLINYNLFDPMWLVNGNF